jgi:stage IV sporulation protein FB
MLSPLQGVRIRIHLLFWLVIFSSVWTGQFLELITLFVLVLIHELGHISAAHSFRWRITSLELLPFGGVAKTDEWGTVPAREEVIVALAGPFHNVMMVLSGLAFYHVGWWTDDWTRYFIQGNTMLALFNLLPAYPLDGGRVMQAVLGRGMSYRKAILWSLRISAVFTMGLLFWSVVGSSFSFNLFVIGLFLLQANWFAWRQKEYQYIRFLMHRRHIPVPATARVISIDARDTDSLLKVIRRFRKEAYHVVHVVDGKGRRLCSIPEEVLLKAYFDDKKLQAALGDLIA